MVIFKKGDITKETADIIVNAANTQLIHGGGVAKAISKAAGKQLEKESRKIGFCPLGEFVITSAGKLSAKKVAHIPTIDYKNNQIIDYSQLERVFEKLLKFCLANNYFTIVSPLLGTGVVGLDKERVKKILTKTADKFKNLKVIIIDK